MAEGNTQPPGAANHGSESSAPVPLQTPADQPPPESAWTPRPDAYAAGQPFTGSGPTVADQPPPTGANYAPPIYGPPRYGPPSYAPPTPPGAGYYGQPGHPAHYATDGYPPSAPTQPSYQINDQYASYYGSAPYSAPPTPPKRRWPLVVVAGLLAFALGLSGYVFAGGQLGAAPGPTVTQPVRPSNGSSTEPTTNAGTQSKTVTATEAKGVALIEAEATSGGSAYGTGMVLTADGKVLTNYHVVAGTTKVAVTIAASGDTYTATLLGFDQTRDVALLQLRNASGLGTVTIDDDPIAVGDEVSAVGNASGGMKLVKADGVITIINQDLTVNSSSPWGNTEDLSGLVATDADAVPGDSGGPMFDAEDEVLGMTTAGSTREHASYAVPIGTALAVVQQIETGQDAGTVRVGPAGFLGVKVSDASYTGMGGATIDGVDPNGPADKAGITAGCRLTKIGDTTITDKTNVAAAIRAVEPGQQVTVWWVTASGKSKHATVAAGASPLN